MFFKQNKESIMKYFSDSYDKMLFFNIMVLKNPINCNNPFILGRKNVLFAFLKS